MISVQFEEELLKKWLFINNFSERSIIGSDDTVWVKNDMCFTLTEAVRQVVVKKVENHNYTEKCEDLVAQGKMVEALKLYRENTGASFKDSKDFVDTLRKNYLSKVEGD